MSMWPEDLAAVVKRHDPDRFLTALFAPAGRRNALFALYAFNYELARIREAVTEPLLGRIRFQWWRDAVAGIYAGQPPPHQVVSALAEAVATRGLDRSLLDGIIDAREADLDAVPPADVPALLGYAESTAGKLTVLALQALEVLGPGAESAGHAVGTAYALVGLVRAVPFQARSRRVTMPSALLAKHKLEAGDLLRATPPAGLSAICEEIARLAQQRLVEARAFSAEIPRRAIPALLPATVCETHLARLARAGYDPFATEVQDRPPGLVWRLAAKAWSGRW